MITEYTVGHHKALTVGAPLAGVPTYSVRTTSEARIRWMYEYFRVGFRLVYCTIQSALPGKGWPELSQPA